MHTSILGIFLSLATGLAIAFYYTLNKKVTRAAPPLQIIFWIFAAHLPPLFIWGWLSAPLHADAGYVLPGLSVLGLTVAGNLLTIRALALSPFSLIIPVMSLSPVFSSLIGIPLLQEWPSQTQWLGISLAVLGVMWLYAPADKPWHVFAFWAAFIRERGAPAMALSALSWSLSAPMDKLALRHADPAFHALFVFTGLVVFLFIWLTARGEWRNAPIAPMYRGWLAGVGAAGATADMIQLFALQQIEVGSFEAIKRVTSQLIALGLAYFMFQEKLTKPKMIGIAIICVGVPLIVI